MQAGRVTCRELVRQYLDRIERLDRGGPRINSLVLINPNAEREAVELDRRFASGGLTGPLHCVPAIVKDNMETVGLATSNGALVFSQYVPRRDAFQVERIKAAGAIVLAKSNMAEWAFSPYETVSSVLPGYTKNPYALDRVTAGSSGGTAAAVAANLGLVGLGSDTGNSIRGPSSHQALVGIRSTMGLTSRSGVFPLSIRADIAGPMTRTVEDAARVLNVIVGQDARDAVTVSRPAVDYAKALNAKALQGARIGILRQAYERDTTDAEIVRVYAKAIEDLKKAGAEVIDGVRVEEIESLRQPRGCMGFKYDLNQFLAERKGQVPAEDLGAIVKSNGFHPNLRGRLETADKGTPAGPESAECKADDEYREKVRQAVLKAMDAKELSALIYPTWSNPPRLIGDLNTPHGDNSQFFSPTTGFPAINVPMGYTRGNTLPIGMTILGRPWSESTLIGLAFSYEQATKQRKSPVMIESATRSR